MSLRDWLDVATRATLATPTAQDSATVANVATVASLADEPAAFPMDDTGVARRRSRALAILVEHPDQRIAVVAEAGDPAHVAVAVRGLAVGDLEIAKEKYDAFALLGLMQQYGHA